MDLSNFSCQENLDIIGCDWPCCLLLLSQVYSTMRLTCIVCRELLLPSDDVNVAPCGHFFHYLCWVGWLERWGLSVGFLLDVIITTESHCSVSIFCLTCSRSKTCPQCRKKTTEKQIFRLYFNIAEGEGEEVEDAAAINNKLDSLTFNLRQRDREVCNLKEELEKEVNVSKELR